MKIWKKSSDFLSISPILSMRFARHFLRSSDLRKCLANIIQSLVADLQSRLENSSIRCVVINEGLTTIVKLQSTGILSAPPTRSWSKMPSKPWKIARISFSEFSISGFLSKVLATWSKWKTTRGELMKAFSQKSLNPTTPQRQTVMVLASGSTWAEC